MKIEGSDLHLTEIENRCHHIVKAFHISTGQLQKLLLLMAQVAKTLATQKIQGVFDGSNGG
jgi:hypothetical protein